MFIPQIIQQFPVAANTDIGFSAESGQESEFLGALQQQLATELPIGDIMQIPSENVPDSSAAVVVGAQKDLLAEMTETLEQLIAQAMAEINNPETDEEEQKEKLLDALMEILSPKNEREESGVTKETDDKKEVYDLILMIVQQMASADENSDTTQQERPQPEQELIDSAISVTESKPQTPVEQNFENSIKPSDIGSVPIDDFAPNAQQIPQSAQPQIQPEAPSRVQPTVSGAQVDFPTEPQSAQTNSQAQPQSVQTNFQAQPQSAQTNSQAHPQSAQANSQAQPQSAEQDHQPSTQPNAQPDVQMPQADKTVQTMTMQTTGTEQAAPENPVLAAKNRTTVQPYAAPHDEIAELINGTAPQSQLPAQPITPNTNNQTLGITLSSAQTPLTEQPTAAEQSPEILGKAQEILTKLVNASTEQPEAQPAAQQSEILPTAVQRPTVKTETADELATLLANIRAEVKTETAVAVKSVENALETQPKQNQAEQASTAPTPQIIIPLDVSADSVSNAKPPEVQLAEIISAKLDSGINGETTFTITLKPKELGEVTVKITELAEKISVQITAPNKQTADILAQRLDGLQNALKQNGVELEKWQVVYAAEHTDDREQSYDGSSKNPYYRQDDSDEQSTDDSDFSELLKEAV